MPYQDGCTCTKEADCPHAAWPGCVNRLKGDLTMAECTNHGALGKVWTWHLDGKCQSCKGHTEGGE